LSGEGWKPDRRSGMHEFEIARPVACELWEFGYMSLYAISGQLVNIPIDILEKVM
jgi:hypothetical protein